MARSGRFLLQQLMLPFVALHHRARPGDLLVKLRNLLVKSVYLRFELQLARRHGRAFVRHCLALVRFAALRRQLRPECRFGVAVALGYQPRLLRLQPDILGTQDVEPRARLGVDQADQRLAFGDDIALADQKLLDDAAVRMLHRLPFTFDLQVTVGDGGAGNRGKRSPRRESAHEAENDDGADQHRPLRHHVGFAAKLGS